MRGLIFGFNAMVAIICLIGYAKGESELLNLIFSVLCGCGAFSVLIDSKKNEDA